MKTNAIILAALLLFRLTAKGQDSISFADSIRNQYVIPELAYAAISSDTIFEMHVLGYQRINSNYTAKVTDRFHIGSNTKAITSFVAALLVKQGLISWNTKFLTLFPELKPGSRQAYQNITLQDLLSFRGKLPSYTYTFEKPAKKQITGNNARQRFLLARYFLSRHPMKKEENGLTPSNADYILAGLMLEKASSKPYKKLISELGQQIGIDFGFDYPNLADTLQPWGHDPGLNPLPPVNNYKLNWLLSAGNLNVSLAGYIKFLQLQLNALKGHSQIISAETADKLMFGLPNFAFGWFNDVDTCTNHHTAFNEGNAGAFITRVQVFREVDRAYIVFTNSATSETAQGITLLQQNLQAKYGK